ncbi:hypothetical protein CR513_38976, partial [Mucuna pruriens]
MQVCSTLASLEDLKPLKTLLSKIENLVEYSYVPEDAQISETSTPLLSPYNIFRRQRSTLRSITRLISTRRPHIKEYVQSSKMECCSLAATSEEQYVTIEIPWELIRHWQLEGYTHLYYGAIRLILSLHGRRGLPVSARVSLLDSSYLHYENAVIGIVLTTLHAGSVILTIFPNYNVSLKDPTISHRLKVQVQITGADQVAEALSATLHHQFIYRLQDHAINLSLPSSNDGALFVMANHQEETPSIVQIPRNTSRDQLQELIPLQWVTNYEKLHENQKPIRSTEATFRRSVDGTVRTIFKKPDEGSGSSSSSIFHSMMIKPAVKEGKIPIWGVRPDGSPIFTDKVNGHFIWDVAPKMCDLDYDCYLGYSDDSEDDFDEDSDDEEEERPCKPPPPPQRRNPKDGPWKYKRGLEILRKEGLLKSPAKAETCRSPIKADIPLAIPCMMLTTYKQEFPPLERKTDPVTKIATKPHISPSEVGTDGKTKPLSQVEEVLNWQTENARVQNSILMKIDQQVDKISSKLDRSDERLDLLSEKMKKLYHQLKDDIVRLDSEWKKTKFGEASNQKEREVRRLKAELQEMENYMDRKMKEKQGLPTEPFSFVPSSIYRTTFQQPSSFFNPPPKTWILPTVGAYRTRTKPKSSSKVSRGKSTNQSSHNSPESSPERQPFSSQEKQAIPEKEYLQDAQDPYSQFMVKLHSVESEYSSSSNSSEATEEEEEYDQTDLSSESSYEDKENINIKNILMANTTRSGERTEAIYDSEEEVISSPPQHGPPKPNSGPWFTLDDIPPNKWRSRLIEFGAWLDTKLMKDSNPYKVIEEF